MLAQTARLILPHWLRHQLRQLRKHPAPNYARLWAESCQKWCLSDVVREGKLLHASGWLIAPPELRSRIEFHINGQPATRVQYPIDRPDVANHFPFVDYARQSGFDIWADWPGDKTDVQLTVHDIRTGQPLGKDYATWWVPSASRSGPMPSGARIRRVIGQALEFNFRTGGLTTFYGLQSALNKTLGKSFADFPRVLDWGCGCARVARFVMNEPGVKLTGVDVDPDNVAWSGEHFPQANWQTVPLRPPTLLPEGYFDLAYGISVFTHLKEPDQNLWLDELRRVLRPGGVALMTFHGPASIVWSRLSGERYRVLKKQGICDQENPIYDAQLAEADYYRDTFHTTDYVRKHWGKYFEIANILPSAISHQDLVIMKK
jgi:SAM-dependent methyltransferase